MAGSACGVVSVTNLTNQKAADMDNYEAPAIVELGSIEDFTQGFGGSQRDFLFGSRPGNNPPPGGGGAFS